MSVHDHAAPVCRRCGNEMYMTRFLSDLSEHGIDREQYYECLWCEDDDAIEVHAPPPQSVEYTAA
jgi:hypothetical protein